MGNPQGLKVQYVNLKDRQTEGLPELVSQLPLTLLQIKWKQQVPVFNGAYSRVCRQGNEVSEYLTNGCSGGNRMPVLSQGWLSVTRKACGFQGATHFSSPESLLCQFVVFLVSRLQDKEDLGVFCQQYQWLGWSACLGFPLPVLVCL